jgi:hypothetical protein
VREKIVPNSLIWLLDSDLKFRALYYLPPCITYLYQVLREIAEMLDGRNMFTVLVIFLQSSLKSVEGCDPEVIHFACVWFSEGIQHKTQRQSQCHVVAVDKQ